MHLTQKCYVEDAPKRCSDRPLSCIRIGRTRVGLERRTPRKTCTSRVTARALTPRRRWMTAPPVNFARSKVSWTPDNPPWQPRRKPCHQPSIRHGTGPGNTERQREASAANVPTGDHSVDAVLRSLQESADPLVRQSQLGSGMNPYCDATRKRSSVRPAMICRACSVMRSTRPVPALRPQQSAQVSSKHGRTM